MSKRWFSTGVLALTLAAVGCGDPGMGPSETAQRFFRAVYGCSGEPLDSLASADVRMSYPIFEDRLGTPVLVGRDAVQDFSVGFCQRWSDPEVTIHEVISDSGFVVLVWSYSALNVADPGSPPSRSSWGGISVFEMDHGGHVLAEYGEESTPGPVARMTK